MSLLQKPWQLCYYGDVQHQVSFLSSMCFPHHSLLSHQLLWGVTDLVAGGLSFAYDPLKGSNKKLKSVFILSQAVILKASAKILELAYTKGKNIAIITVNSSLQSHIQNTRQKYLYTKICSLYQPEWLTWEASLFSINKRSFKEPHYESEWVYQTATLSFNHGLLLAYSRQPSRS